MLGGKPLIFWRKKLRRVGESETLQSIFKKYSVYEIDSKAIVHHLKHTSWKKELTLQLADEYFWHLQLEQVIITTPETRIVLATEEGKEQEPFFFDKAFKGNIDNTGNNSEVRLVVDESFIYGYIEDKNDVFYIEPLSYFQDSPVQDHYVIYKNSDVKPNPNHICGAVETASKSSQLNPELNGNGGANTKAGDCKAIGMFIAADYSMYQKYNQSIGNIANHVIGVINNVNGFYDDEFEDEIRFVVGGFFFSTCSSCDPWVSSNPVNAEQLRDEFRDWGNSGGFCNANNGLHELWTNRNLFAYDDNGNQNYGVIGIAYLPGVCNSYSYNVIEDGNGLFCCNPARSCRS